MKISTISLLLIGLLISVGGCTNDEGAAQANDESTFVPTSAENIRPLLIGATVPPLVLEDAEGQPFDLNQAIAEQPTILIFYRGGWCPYCNTHLGRLATIESQLTDLGYQILAVSADRPEKVAATADEHDFAYRLLSDHRMEAAKAFGVAFKVDDATLDKYAGYGVDLEAASGQTHHLLPVPSVFIIGTDGLVRFVHANPDYKVRIDPEVLVAAAKATLR